MGETQGSEQDEQDLAMHDQTIKQCILAGDQLDRGSPM
jgi:hypothetical protein